MEHSDFILPLFEISDEEEEERNYGLYLWKFNALHKPYDALGTELRMSAYRRMSKRVQRKIAATFSELKPKKPKRTVHS